MKKNKKALIGLFVIIIILVVIMFSLLFKNDVSVTSLHYKQYNSEFSESYEIKLVDGFYSITISDLNQEKENTYPYDQQFIDSLNKIVKEYKLYKVKEREKSNLEVLDGESFSLLITFSNSTEVKITSDDIFSNTEAKGISEIINLFKNSID